MELRGSCEVVVRLRRSEGQAVFQFAVPQPTSYDSARDPSEESFAPLPAKSVPRSELRDNMSFGDRVYRGALD